MNSVDRAEFRKRFARLGVWEQNGVRAPYKPLLLLRALAHYRSGGERLIPFVELDGPLKALFRSFAPARRTYHPEYPFWYLQTDGLWEVVHTGELEVRRGTASTPTKGSLIKAGARGGLTPELYAAVAADAELVRQIAGDLLTAHYPETAHEDILSAVGLELTVVRAVRNALFRQDVLVAYGHRCALCGFDARILDSLIGVEAAHVKWHQAGGPGTISNGIAMCSLHHKLFDRGAFTLTSDYRIEVSEQVNGGPTTSAQVVAFHSRRIALPSGPASRPAGEYVKWHRDQVFKAPGRWMDAA